MTQTITAEDLESAVETALWNYSPFADRSPICLSRCLKTEGLKYPGLCAPG